MKPAVLSSVIAGVLVIASTSAPAELAPDAILTIDAPDSVFLMGGAGGTPTALTGFDGLVLGTDQPATGSHSGAPGCTNGVGSCNNPGENPGIDNPWGFFGNTGMHQTTSAAAVLTASGNQATIDFSGWNVTWNGIPSIAMGTDSWNDDGAGWSGHVDGVAQVSCAVDCSSGDTYALEYTATVPAGDPSGFGGVAYGLRLSGRILDPNSIPVAAADESATVVATPVVINVVANDLPNPDPTTVTVVGAASNGTTDTTAADGTITYTPNGGFTGDDSFTYTVANANGTSAPATVTVTVTTNVAPVAVDDTHSVGTGVLDNGAQTVSVLANDTDSNNVAGQPGGLDPTSVTVLSTTGEGICTANADGTITYSQTAPSVETTAVCTYRVSDSEGLSDTATLTVTVVATQSDWPLALASDVIPILYFEAGQPGHPTDSSVPASSGSYFTMQLSQATTIFTVIEPGPNGGLVIGHDQPASGTHSGLPTGNEEAGLDQPWQFFNNTGLHFTRNGGITGNPDGTLDFARKWFVTWNGIPAIDLGGATATFPDDLGFATIICDPAPCADQSTFELQYAAHVPPGDPSGFGGVPYTLIMSGTVALLDGNLQTSNGTATSMTRLLSAAVTTSDPDADVELQCVGDCVEYSVTGVTDPRISIVFPLAGGVPLNPVWRILENGAWRSFDTSTGDSIRSAPLAAGATQCPAPGDAAYVEITSGHQCVQLSVSDNGPNDLNQAVGTISDPGGLGSGGTAGGGTAFVDTRTSSTSGCTIATRPASIGAAGDWLLVGLTLVGLAVRRRRMAA